MTDDGQERRRFARLVRPPAELFRAACGVVLVGLAISVGLYAAFSDGRQPFGETLGLGVLLPAPALLFVAWLAIRGRSSWLGIAASLAASELALAAAWDATVNGTGSTAALAIVGAPAFMALCGGGVLVIEQVAQALLRRTPVGQPGSRRRHPRAGHGTRSWRSRSQA